MSDSYQIGNDLEWVKHTNDELTRLVKKRNAQLKRWKGLALILVLALGWVGYKYSLKGPLRELWQVELPWLSKNTDHAP